LSRSATFDDNASAWLAGAPPDEPAPPLARDLTVDIAIIGGGFTGVSTAYHLASRHPELGIALLEARQLGNGASGRNGGLVLNGITVLDFDPDVAAREHAITRGAIDAIADLIREHALPVRFQRTGCLRVATTPESAEAAHAEVEALAARGVPVRYVPAAELPVRGGHGGIFDPTEATIAGIDLVRAMRPLLVARGVQIFEGTHVTKIRERETLELVTSGGTVRARTLVLATSGYTPRLGYFTTGLLPVISHVIATEPVPADVALPETGFFDDLPRLGYASITPDRRVVFGGGTTAAYAYRFGNRTGDPGPFDDAPLRATLAGYLPQLAAIPIAHRWSGPLDLTLVRHCAIGVLRERIYYALGYSGHGITLANLAGRVLVDLYDDHHEPWRDCAFYMKRPSGIPPEPLRWLGYQLYTRITGRSPWRRSVGP
jgi:gamma-glutamylputrescine oxidase